MGKAEHRRRSDKPRVASASSSSPASKAGRAGSGDGLRTAGLAAAAVTATCFALFAGLHALDWAADWLSEPAARTGGAVPARSKKAWRAAQDAFAAFPAKAHAVAHENVGLVRRDGWGFALQAQAGVEANQSLLALPAQSVMTVRSVMASPLIRKVMDRYQMDVEEVLDGDEFLFNQFVLAVGLLAEKLHHRNGSALHEWVDSLPTELRSDMFWSDEEATCLPEMPRRARARRLASAGKMHRCVAEYFTRYDAFWGEVTERDVRWAYATVASRVWWREEPEHLALYPIFDVTDQRARHYGGSVWRPLAVNAKVLVDEETGSVHLISHTPLQKGDFVSTSPLKRILPSDAAPIYGVVDPDFTHALSHMDLTEVDAQNCTMAHMLLHKDGSPSEATSACLLKYRGIPDTAPEEVREKFLRKFLGFHADRMLKEWAVAPTGQCSAQRIASRANGAEVLSLLVSHYEVYTRLKERCTK